MCLRRNAIDEVAVRGDAGEVMNAAIGKPHRAKRRDIVRGRRREKVTKARDRELRRAYFAVSQSMSGRRKRQGPHHVLFAPENDE